MGSKALFVGVFLGFLHLSAALYGAKSDVEILTSKNFKEKVLQSDEIWIVEFFAPWCGHCKSLAPEYEKAAKNLKGIVRVGAIDCDNDKDLAGQYGIKGFPTIKYFPYEGKKNPYKAGDITKTPEDYQGGRTAKDIVDFALGKLPSKFVTSLTPKSIEAFASKDPSLPKVVLFTNKTPTTALYKSLTLQFKGRLTFGEVRHTEKDLVSKFGVSSFPTLMVLKPGDETPHVYDGELKPAEIAKFLKQFAGKKVEEEPAAEKKKADKEKAKKKVEVEPEPEPEVPNAHLWKEVHEVRDQKSFEEVCNAEGGICIVALLPLVEPEEPDSDKERTKFVGVLNELAQKHNSAHLFRFVWMEGPAQSKFADYFQLSNLYPQVMMLSVKKSRYAVFFGSFTTEHLAEFTEKISSGGIRTIPYETSRVPTLVDVGTKTEEKVAAAEPEAEQPIPAADSDADSEMCTSKKSCEKEKDEL